MSFLLALANVIKVINDLLLGLARMIGTVAFAAMLAAILIQIGFRYILGTAQPWPAQAALFFMLWMAGLMAPTAFRSSGFVAIDIIDSLIPSMALRVLQILLLLICLTVLIMALQIGWAEVNGLGGRFAAESLYLPTSFGFDTWYRVPRNWMMLSLFVGVVLLTLVTVELILRRVISLFGGGDGLPVIGGPIAGDAE